MWLFTKDTNIPSCWNRNWSREEGRELASGMTENSQGYPKSVGTNKHSYAIRFHHIHFLRSSLKKTRLKPFGGDRSGD